MSKIANSELRTVQRLDGGVWTTVRLCDIKKGDTFRIFEPGEPVKDANGKTEWVAESDSYTDAETGVTAVKVNS